MKFHKQNYKYKAEMMNLQDVTAEVILRIRSKNKLSKGMYALVKDNGRLILAFKNQEWFLEFIELIETDVNEYGDDWHQVGNTERFGEVVVAEFWTEEKYEFEESRYYDDMTRAYFDIDEEPHRKTVWDVYSTSELL